MRTSITTFFVTIIVFFSALGTSGFSLTPQHLSKWNPASFTSKNLAFIGTTTSRSSTKSPASTSNVATSVTSEELEMMLHDWDVPLVIDAYASWCGPCKLMAPEFETAAQELEGRVRFVKLDTEKEEQMASRLHIQGLPTILFLSKLGDGLSGGINGGALRDRIEGAINKEDILSLCEKHFFTDQDDN